MRARAGASWIVRTALAMATLALVASAAAADATRPPVLAAPSMIRGAVCLPAGDGSFSLYVTDPDCWSEWSAALAVTPPSTLAGMRVGKDAETGLLGVPSPEQLEELAALESSSAIRSPLMNFSHEGLTIVSWPDGSLSMDLMGRLTEYAVIRLGTKGARWLGCMPVERVHAALARSLAPAAPEDR